MIPAEVQYLPSRTIRQPREIFREALGEAVIGVGPVWRVDADSLGFWVHADRVDGRGIDHPAQPVAMRGLPDVIGADDIGAEDLFERGLIAYGAEMNDHLGPLQQVHDGGLIAQIGADIGFVRGKRAHAVNDIAADEAVAHGRERPAQD